MHLDHLSLTNFRNYARLELELPDRAVVIVGDNAQGKSNLLEAIYFLATARSFRANSDRELINWLAAEDDVSFARLLAGIQKQHGSLRVEILIKEEGRRLSEQSGVTSPTISKRVKVNNIARRSIDLIGQVNAVMFSPQDIDLVSGPPQLRRRYLDVTISQVDPRYCRSLAHYNRVLLRRNHLLRQIREKHSDPDELQFWDQELVNAGAYVILQRLETVAVLDELTFGLHRKLTGSQERLRVAHRLSLENGAGVAAPQPSTLHPQSSTLNPQPSTPGLLGVLSLDLATATPEAKSSAIAEVFRRQLAKFRQREITYGVSLIGPHRDDLAFIVDNRDMNTYGSRGQQRTVALSLKLAEMEFMRRRTEEEPILLLDDVASELDARRRGYVMEAIRTWQQVIVTTSDLGAIESEFVAGAAPLRVENGAIRCL